MPTFHLTNFGSFGAALSAYARDGYVTYSGRKLAVAHRARLRGEESGDAKHDALAAAEVALGRWQAGAGPGRPPESPTGERRAEVRWSIAPSARARVEAEAARRGVSPSALVEEWALSLGDRR